eukprot:31527-Pelagococcus_subviridis.AAC.1
MKAPTTPRRSPHRVSVQAQPPEHVSIALDATDPLRASGGVEDVLRVPARVPPQLHRLAVRATALQTPRVRAIMVRLSLVSLRRGRREIRVAHFPRRVFPRQVPRDVVRILPAAHLPEDRLVVDVSRVRDHRQRLQLRVRQRRRRRRDDVDVVRRRRVQPRDFDPRVAESTPDVWVEPDRAGSDRVRDRAVEHRRAIDGRRRRRLHDGVANDRDVVRRDRQREPAVV